MGRVRVPALSLVAKIFKKIIHIKCLAQGLIYINHAKHAYACQYYSSSHSTKLMHNSFTRVEVGLLAKGKGRKENAILYKAPK